MGLGKVSYVFRLGTEDGRGWPGNVKFMLLDISKLETQAGDLDGTQRKP